MPGYEKCHRKYLFMGGKESRYYAIYRIRSCVGSKANEPTDVSEKL